MKLNEFITQTIEDIYKGIEQAKINLGDTDKDHAVIAPLRGAGCEIDINFELSVVADKNHHIEVTGSASANIGKGFLAKIKGSFNGAYAHKNSKKTLNSISFSVPYQPGRIKTNNQ